MLYLQIYRLMVILPKGGDLMLLQSNLEELKMRKRELKLTNQELSEKSGVPIGTLNKILSGATLYPRKETIDALLKAMDLEYYTHEEHAPDTFIVRETSAYAASNVEEKPENLDIDTRPTQKDKFTIEDYYALPDEKRVELIDGKFYEMTAPSANHQFILLKLAAKIDNYLLSINSKCRVVFAPFDVQLDMDNYTMVQPDLMIICDRSKYENGTRCFGAPDFIVEVISPSNPAHDYLLKLNKYLNAGVSEYWIVDPIKKQVFVYLLKEGVSPDMYTFNDKVKSLFFTGLEIDFAEITKILL